MKLPMNKASLADMPKRPRFFADLCCINHDHSLQPGLRHPPQTAAYAGDIRNPIKRTDVRKLDKSVAMCWRHNLLDDAARWSLVLIEMATQKDWRQQRTNKNTFFTNQQLQRCSIIQRRAAHLPPFIYVLSLTLISIISHSGNRVIFLVVTSWFMFCSVVPINLSQEDMCFKVVFRSDDLSPSPGVLYAVSRYTLINFVTIFKQHFH